MSNWVKGNGSDLPNGTWAWIRWNASRSESGHGMTIEYRRDGGWGSNGENRDCFEEPNFPDDGVGKSVWISQEAGLEPILVTHYKIIEVPDYPSED